MWWHLVDRVFACIFVLLYPWQLRFTLFAFSFEWNCSTSYFGKLNKCLYILLSVLQSPEDTQIWTPFVLSAFKLNRTAVWLVALFTKYLINCLTCLTGQFIAAVSKDHFLVIVVVTTKKSILHYTSCIGCVKNIVTKCRKILIEPIFLLTYTIKDRIHSLNFVINSGIPYNLLPWATHLQTSEIIKVWGEIMRLFWLCFGCIKWLEIAGFFKTLQK